MTHTQTPKKYCFPTIDSSRSDGHLGDHHTERDLEKAKIQSVDAQGYQDGLEKSEQASLEFKNKRAEPLMLMLKAAKISLEEHMVRIRNTSENDTIQMAVAMAQRILQHEIMTNPVPTTKIIQSAIQMAIGQANIKIKAHPEEGETVRTILQDQIPDTDANERVDVVADRSIHRGGCLVETDFGTIDARIEQQLATIENSLRADGCDVQRNAPGSHSHETSYQRLQQRVINAAPIQSCGHVTKVVGLVIESKGPVAQLGALCDIYGKDNETPVSAEVLGFRDQTVLMMPLEDIRSIGPGSRVVARQSQASVPVGQQLLGRVIDGLGNPIDGAGALVAETTYPIYAQPINPLLRKRIRTPLDMGIRAINGLLTVGCGQRMGIFAGSGVGKSVLMGMIARKSCADVNVIALIGERGRELNEFIDKELGEEGLKKSVVVVATSDHLPLVRVRGAFVATAIAEYFRDQGLHVNLMMDSLTRFAMAQREIGLALGEPPTTKGYTPSVLTMLPKLLERAGTSDHTGTITGLYTVLVEGDDMNEPIADAARSILDGHIVLTRELSDRNHYPAIDILASISRVMTDIAGLKHKHNAGQLKELLATYRKAEDLINIGAYVKGSNKGIDRAISKIDDINGYLRQDISENINFDDSLQKLELIMTTGA
jgi:flagellum-specific ATP synthase